MPPDEHTGDEPRSSNAHSLPRWHPFQRLRLGMHHAVWRKSLLVRAVLFALGILLIVAGFLLGFIPFLPGWPLGLAGVFLLSMSSRRVRVLLRRLSRRLPVKWRSRLHFLKGRRTPEERPLRGGRPVGEQPTTAVGATPPPAPNDV